MKNKIITTMLFLVLVVSIVGNVYQFNVSKDIEDNIGCYTTELSGLNDNIDSLNSDITAKDNELATLSTKLAELESSIQSVQTENDSLSAQIADLEKEKNEIDIEKRVETDLAEISLMGQPSETFLKYSEKYKNGEISEEMYNKIVELEKQAQERDLDAIIDKKIQEALSQPEVIMPEGALELTPMGPDENIQMQHFESGSGVQVQ